ncbi:hypothetical protein HZ994_02340 [Akkermansiaceae bacterium]|nr:hypothetical protein HZ994_02340 [Akkermansiaceae bacterium]
MKTYFKVLAVLLAIQLLPSCKSEEEKRREAQIRIHRLIDQNASRMSSESERRRAEDEAALEILGRAIGQGLQQGGQSGGDYGGASQRERDEYYRRQNQRGREEDLDTIIRGY